MRERGLKPGVMVEVPSAALLAHRMLEVVDFLSIGTNDLTQYTMAADRMATDLAHLTDAWQPAVLQLIAITAEAGKQAGKPVGVCGEAAADPLLACVLVGMGITSLSMASAAVARWGPARRCQHGHPRGRRRGRALRAATRRPPATPYAGCSAPEWRPSSPCSPRSRAPRSPAASSGRGGGGVVLDERDQGAEEVLEGSGVLEDVALEGRVRQHDLGQHDRTGDAGRAAGVVVRPLAAKRVGVAPMTANGLPLIAPARTAATASRWRC